MRRYITMLSTDDYLPGVLVLDFCLKIVQSKYPLVVAINESISKETIEILKKNDIDYINIESVPKPKIENQYGLYAYWLNTFDKIALFNLIQYEKLVYVDSDMLVLKNIDELFDKPKMSAVRAGQLKNPDWRGLNSGLVVIEPNKADYKGLVDTIVNYNGDKEIGDQDIMAMYFDKWADQNELHLPEEYNIFYCYAEEYLKEPFNLKRENYKIIHFIGKKKPWHIAPREVDIFLSRASNSDYMAVYLKLIKIVTRSYYEVIHRKGTI